MFKDQIWEIKQQSIAYDHRKANMEVHAVSAAVFNHLSKPVAAISICVPANRINKITSSKYINMLKKQTWPFRIGCSSKLRIRRRQRRLPSREFIPGVQVLKDRWNSRPQDIRRIIDAQSGLDFIRRMDRIFDRSESVVYKNRVAEYDQKFGNRAVYQLPQDERRRVIDATAPVIVVWVEKHEKRPPRPRHVKQYT